MQDTASRWYLRDVTAQLRLPSSAYINGGLWVLQPDIKIGAALLLLLLLLLFFPAADALTAAAAGEYLWQLMAEGWPEVHPNGTYDESRPRAFWRVADQVRRACHAASAPRSASQHNR